MASNQSHPPVGIDLGTTFSAVAFLDADGRPETIRNSEGDLTTPSAVFFDHQRPIVGMEAVEAGLLEPDRLAQFAKRDVGERYYDKRIRGKHLPAEVIQALVLRKLKADAELKLGEIQEAVITVPAFFNEPCRKATQDAGRLAGLKVLDIINEPTAAAITYGVQQGFLRADGNSDQRELVLVYDLGGGTFDVTVMEIEQGNFNTIATAGDVYLGGIDWDNRIVDLIAEAFIAEHGLDPRQDPQAEQELLRKANQTKHALTQRESVTVAFANDGRRLRTEITAEVFGQRCADLVERTLMTVQLVLDDAKISWSDLTRLILVGGSTRMPMIRNELQRLSGMELDRSLSPDEAVSHGAALYAGMLSAGKNDTSGISVRNVNSHDLGVLAVDPRSDKPRRKIMIPRNSHLPASKMVRFRTHQDNQPNVKIAVVEGGDKRGINATRIGKCVVTDLPEGTPKGTNVDVRFDYTADGRLTVHASLPEIDRTITMTLDRASGLSDDDIVSWSKRLDEGFSDAVLAVLESVEDDDSLIDAQPEAAPEELGMDLGETTSPAETLAPIASASDNPTEGTPSAPAASSPPDSSSAAAILNVTGLPPGTASANPAAATPATEKNAPQVAAPQVAASQITAVENTHPGTTSAAAAAGNTSPSSPAAVRSPLQIDLTDAAPAAPRITADDAKALSGFTEETPAVIKEKPILEIDPKDAGPTGSADANDLAMLASLENAAPQKSSGSADIPLINTNSPVSSSEKAKPKRSGGLFRRKKK